MRVFMLGWEFPPFISGGLGTACYGLTKAMSSIGMDVLFVLPRPVATPFSTHVQLVSPRPDSPLAMPSTEIRMDEFDHVTFRTVDAALVNPYHTPDSYAKEMSPRQTLEADVKRVRRPVSVTVPAPAAPPPPPPQATPGFISPPVTAGAYSGDLFAEVQRYATLASEIARTEKFDIVHAHDWMTFPAAIALAVAGEQRQVPLVVHIHSTEFDRSARAFASISGFTTSSDAGMRRQPIEGNCRQPSSRKI